MADRVVRNVEKDYLICSICLGRYRDPRLLPCGHTFCLKCLEDHIRETVSDRAARSFTCPNDRTQVSSPSVGLPPRQWASAFPADSFLGSLIHAVRLHEASAADHTEDLSCSQHGGRLLEFYCLGCNAIICPYCAVRNHRNRNCECISIDDAVDKMRPRIDALRQKFQQQIQTARQLSREDNEGDVTLAKGKEQTLQQIDDIEARLSEFHEASQPKLTEFRQQVLEAGLGQVSERDQMSFVLENLNAAIQTFDNICERGNGAEIINSLPRIEAQVGEFEIALAGTKRQTGSLHVQFIPSQTLEQLLKSPSLGVVRVSGEPESAPAASFFANPRNCTAQVPTATVRPTVAMPTSSACSRTKMSFSVKIAQERASNWHLTGITCVGETVIVADSHNNKLRQCNYTRSLSLRSYLAVECPISVAVLKPSNDIAVTQPEKKQIMIISTQGGLRTKECIKTQKPYEGICQLGPSALVGSCCLSGRQSVDILDNTGRVLKSFQKDSSGQPLFGWPRFVACTSARNILVSDRDQRLLLCLDQNGQVKWMYTPPASPWGVACDGRDKVYLCLDNNIVQVLREDGHVLEDRFVSAKDGIKVPYAICARDNHVAITEWGTSLFAPNSPWVHVFPTG